MSDFEQATIWLRELKPIRRSHWCKTFYLKLNSNFQIVEMNGKPFVMKLQSLCGQDWEIYKEPEFCLSDKIKPMQMIMQKDVKEFIKLQTYLFYDLANNPLGFDLAEFLIGNRKLIGAKLWPM